jgi:hypothetical protein
MGRNLKEPSGDGKGEAPGLRDNSPIVAARGAANFKEIKQ